MLVSPLLDHPRFLLVVVVLDEEPGSWVVLSHSWEDVLHKQIPIALGIQPALEDGDAAGASARNGAKDKGLQTSGRTLKPLFCDSLPSLGPNMASRLRAVDGGDVKENGMGPDPIPALSAPLEPMAKICLCQLGLPLLGSWPIPKPLPLFKGCAWGYVDLQLLLRQGRQLLPSHAPVLLDQ